MEVKLALNGCVHLNTTSRKYANTEYAEKLGFTGNLTERNTRRSLSRYRPETRPFGSGRNNKELFQYIRCQYVLINVLNTEKYQYACANTPKFFLYINGISKLRATANKLSPTPSGEGSGKNIPDLILYYDISIHQWELATDSQWRINCSNYRLRGAYNYSLYPILNFPKTTHIFIHP